VTRDDPPTESTQGAGLAPRGLIRCEVCGEWRGSGVAPDPPDGATVSTAKISCLCDGLVCGNCGQERIHRPVSDRYDEESGTVWHLPYFMGLKNCRVCGARDWVDEYDESRAVRKREAAATASASRPPHVPDCSEETRAARAKAVVLFAGTLPSGLTSHAEAYINDAGDLVVEVQDLGQELQELFGDSDYEWWVVVRESEKPRLLTRLLEEQPTSTALTESDQDALLLSLIERRFAGLPSAPSDFEDWCEANAIAFERTTYA
jgi:hypothetical protein